VRTSIAVYGWVGASALLGGGSLVLFARFLFAGPLGLLDLGLSDAGALALDGLLSGMFFLQHSLMTRSWFRRSLSRVLGEEYHGAFFSAASGIALLVVVLPWQGTTSILFHVEGPARWALRGLFLLGMLGFVWGTRSLRPLDTLGLREALRHRDGRSPVAPRFRIRGPYRWVRHPLYTFSLVLFWSYPDPTADRLLFNAVWTVWIVIGTLLEERDLVRTFGEDYRDYRRQVPMLVPYRRPVPERRGG
jgi:protein-S-isoprenylcysteine O-methyltransferase Ste14